MQRIFLFAIISVLSCLVKAQDAQVEQDSSNLIVSDYTLQPLDLIQIRVFQEPSMDRDVRVSREAVVVLPLIGRVSLEGLTIRNAEEKIRELYDRDYLVNPQLNLTVLEYARRTVNVLGAVGKPGEIAFPREEGLSLLDAVSRAGGFTRLADRRKVKLTRKLPDGEVENFIVNADDLIKGESAEQWLLHTGDLVFVPERII